MYIYRGKLDFAPSDSQNATYEAITTMFPSEFRLGNPVYTCWQWSAFGGSKNVPCWLTGIIDSVDNSDTDGKKIGFYGGHYRFDTTLPQGLMPYPFLANIGYYRFDEFLSGPKGIEELSLVVRSGNVVGTAINTMLIFRPDDPGPTIDQDVIVPRIYLGKLSNYAPYSIDQLLLVVIPRWTVGEGNPVCAFWQWAVDIHDSTKVNVDFTTLKMTNVENVADGVSFRFSDSSGYFAFHATMGLKDTAEHWEREQQQLTLTMTTPYLSTGSLMLELRDLRPSPGGRQPRGFNDSTTE